MPRRWLARGGQFQYALKDDSVQGLNLLRISSNPMFDRLDYHSSTVLIINGTRTPKNMTLGQTATKQSRRSQLPDVQPVPLPTVAAPHASTVPESSSFDLNIFRKTKALYDRKSQPTGIRALAAEFVIPSLTIPLFFSTTTISRGYRN